MIGRRRRSATAIAIATASASAEHHAVHAVQVGQREHLDHGVEQHDRAEQGVQPPGGRARMRVGSERSASISQHGDARARAASSSGLTIAASSCEEDTGSYPRQRTIG